MNQTSQVTDYQRQLNFLANTRQHIQSMPAYSGAEYAETKFKLDNARYGAFVNVRVEAVLNVKHDTSTSFIPAVFAPYNLIDRVVLDLNNGFSPYSLTGKHLYLYSLLREQSDIMNRKESGQRGLNVMGMSASPTGVDNKISFNLMLPIQLNKRDPIAYIDLQNQQVNATVSVQVGKATKLLESETGYTVALESITFFPHIISYSVPFQPDARLNLNSIKLVQSQTQEFNSAGEKQISLQTGITYRKLVFMIADASGVGIEDRALSGTIDLVLNTADKPIRINPVDLANINIQQYGQPLPQGVYALDFTDQGLVNYGGLRDLYYTNQLTEFWLTFNAPSAGSIDIVSERISPLR